MPEKRYQVISKPADHCLGPRDESGRPRLEATLVGRLTEEEFRKEFGEEEKIATMMCLETDDIDGYTIHVLLTDVLACENRHSHQHMLVDGMLKVKGMGPLDEHEVMRRGRDYEDISPDAVQFLLSCAVGGMSAGECDPADMAERAAEDGFTLDDFLRPEGEDPED